MERKHFSHHHYLKFNQMPPVTGTQCSGCKFPVTGSAVYVCWQCSFFLHQQCFEATRALSHHSHPPHPLTLTPSPTYASSSFICNSCSQTGHGFSYTCAHCDFDLHVHCAYLEKPYAHVDHSQFSHVPQNTHHEYVVNSPNLHNSVPNSLQPSFNNPSGYETTFYEQTSAFNPQTRPETAVHDSYLNVQYVNHSLSCPTPNFSSSSPFIPQTTHHEFVGNGPIFQSTIQNSTINPSLNTEFHYETASYGPNIQNPSPNLSSSNTSIGPKIAFDHQSLQNSHSTPNPMVTSFNVQTCPETVTHQPVPSIPNQQESKADQIANASDNGQTRPATVIHQPAPTDQIQQESKADQGENRKKPRRVKHFSHRHALFQSEIREENEILCSCCDQKISGLAYTCTMSNCNFNLHSSCFRLPREIQHKAHPKHGLTLLNSPPYEETDVFTCDVCLQKGACFTYHCSTCKFDLHVNCAFLSETITHEPDLNKPNQQEAKPDQQTNVSVSGENRQKLHGVKHFSHHHPLLLTKVREENEILCSCCEQKIAGSAYTCSKSNCNFYLHNSCFRLPQEIQHVSHPKHALTLLSSPQEANEFTCDACSQKGASFTYHCSTCNFDIHVNCAFLSASVKHEDHEHPLALLYSSPFKSELIFACDMCRESIDRRSWFYYCQDCDYGTHLACVKEKVCVQQEESSEVQSGLASALETQVQLKTQV